MLGVKRFLIFCVVVVTMSMSLVGCSEKEEMETVDENKASIKIVMSGPKAPPTIPMLRMMETNVLGEDVEVEFKIWNSPEELMAIASKKDFDFLALPVNVAAKLYNKGIDIKMLNVNTWGVIYLVAADGSVNEWSDLKGKELYVALQSAPPDIITQYFLRDVGLDPAKDMNIKYSTQPEIAQLFSSGSIKYAVNIEPFITASLMNVADARIVFDYNEEWKKFVGEEFEIPTAAIAVPNELLSLYPELAEKFQKEYEIALSWVKDNPEEAGKLANKYFGIKPELVANAMPRLGLNFVDMTGAKADLNRYYEVLVEVMPQSIGGKIPDEGLYYEQ